MWITGGGSHHVLAKNVSIFGSYLWTSDMIVGLVEARAIIHFEDIACEMSLLAYSPHSTEMDVSHLVMMSDIICDPSTQNQSHRAFFRK